MSVRSWVGLALLAMPALALGQERDKSAMFGGSDEAPADAGVLEPRPSEGSIFDGPVSDGGLETRDTDQLSGPAGQNQFDTGGQTVDPLQIGGTLYIGITNDIYLRVAQIRPALI